MSAPLSEQELTQASADVQHASYCQFHGMSFSVAQLQSLLAEVRQARQEKWTCFHCGETFTNRAEASEHFGYSDRMIPACRMTVADVRILRDLEREIAAVRHENETLENDSRLWLESQDDRIRRIGNVEWWQELDSKQGEIIALTAQLAEARQERTCVWTREETGRGRKFIDYGNRRSCDGVLLTYPNSVEPKFCPECGARVVVMGTEGK